MTSQEIRNIVDLLMAKANAGEGALPWECAFYASNLAIYAKDVEIMENQPIPMSQRAPLNRKFGVIRGGGDTP